MSDGAVLIVVLAVLLLIVVAQEVELYSRYRERRDLLRLGKRHVIFIVPRGRVKLLARSTLADLATRCGLPVRDIESSLGELEKLGNLRRIGASGRAVAYEVDVDGVIRWLQHHPLPLIRDATDPLRTEIPT